MPSSRHSPGSPAGRQRDFSAQNLLPHGGHTYLHLAASSFDWAEMDEDLLREIEGSSQRRACDFVEPEPVRTLRRPCAAGAPPAQKEILEVRPGRAAPAAPHLAGASWGFDSTGCRCPAVEAGSYKQCASGGKSTCRCRGIILAQPGGLHEPRPGWHSVYARCRPRADRTQAGLRHDCHCYRFVFPQQRALQKEPQPICSAGSSDRAEHLVRRGASGMVEQSVWPS